MRLLLLVATILISLPCSGQEWHLNKVHEFEVYGHEYWFQLENIEDTSTYDLKKSLGDESSIIYLRDKNEAPIDLTSIQIRNLKTGMETSKFTDLEGKCQLLLEEGKYEIQVSVINYDPFELVVDLAKNKHINLTIKLGLAFEEIVYQIESKDELEELEIIKIMNCVKKSKDQFYEKCSHKEKYLISVN